MTEEQRKQIRELFAQQRYEEILDLCQNLINTGDNSAEIYSAKGLAYFRLEQYEQAINEYNKCIEIDPNYSKALYWRGNSYFELGEYTKALNDFLTLNSIDIDSKPNEYIGLCYHNLQEFEKAIVAYTEYLNSNIDMKILRHRAECYSFMDHEELAFQDYLQILEFEAKNNELMAHLANINIHNFVQQNSDIMFESTEFIPTKLNFSEFLNDVKTGIYILEFNNQEYYIGQSVNIYSRIKSHQKTYNDILKIYCKGCLKEELYKEECKMIAIFEQNSIRLRNLKQISFENHFSEEHYLKWKTDLEYNHIKGKKFDNQAIRDKYRSRFEIFKRHKDFNIIAKFLNLYIKRTIPNYIAGEYNYWSLSCLPNYPNKGESLCRININNVPVLSLFDDDDGAVVIMLYASKFPFLNFIDDGGLVFSLVKTIPSFRIELRDAFEESAKGDDIAIFFNLENYEAALNNDLILSSIRNFNIAMHYAVGKEREYRRVISHCPDLVNYVLEFDYKYQN